MPTVPAAARPHDADAERPQLLAAADLGTTKAKILDAAYRRRAREEQVTHRAALDAMERLLEGLDARARKRGPAPRTAAPRRSSKRRRT